MSRLLISAALALTSLSAGLPPAQAHHPTYAQPLLNELRSQGIRVYPNQRQCGGRSNVLGTYNGYTKVFCLVSPLIIGERWYTTLVHESMHVVQDKLDGYNTATLASVLETYERFNGREARNKLIQGWKDAVGSSHAHGARAYARKQPSHTRYVLEWEAEMAEHFPDVVLDMLRK